MMIQITFDEQKLIAIIRQAIKDELELQQTLNSSAPVQNEHRYLYSMQELADFLHCSIPTAQRMKNEGRFPFRQSGRKLIFDTLEINKIMEHTQKKQRKT